MDYESDTTYKRKSDFGDKRREENRKLKKRIKDGLPPSINTMTGIATFPSGDKYRTFKTGWIKIKNNGTYILNTHEKT